MLKVLEFIAMNGKTIQEIGNPIILVAMVLTLIYHKNHVRRGLMARLTRIQREAADLTFYLRAFYILYIPVFIIIILDNVVRSNPVRPTWISNHLILFAAIGICFSSISIIDNYMAYMKLKRETFTSATVQTLIHLIILGVNIIILLDRFNIHI